jgi:hypothetical protein
MFQDADDEVSCPVVSVSEQRLLPVREVLGSREPERTRSHQTRHDPTTNTEYSPDPMANHSGAESETEVREPKRGIFNTPLDRP